MSTSTEEKILNPEQKAAVEHEGGPLLIIAGAGTGKTTVITERIKWLITQEKAKPSEILALSFTDKAAREMEERVDVALPYGYSQMWISTFHSFGDRILRNEAIHIGLDPGYRLMTEAEAIIFFRKHLFAFELDYFRPLGNPTKFVAGILQHFSRLKDEDVSPNEYLHWAKVQSSRGEKGEIQEVEKSLELASAYQKYEKLKAKEGMMDFADLIGNTLRLFRERTNILKSYREQFKYILVDEFQDTNYAQYEMVKLLAPPSSNPNLTVVGDDNQSIYRFRGAAVSNIIMFMDHYQGAKTVVLTQNYRSTQEILDRAYQLIKHNDPDTLEAKLGINKKLTSIHNPRGGEPIEWIYTQRVEDETEEVAKKIRQLPLTSTRHAELGSTFTKEIPKQVRDDGLRGENRKYQWKDFAILVRANNHADPFVKALSRAGIPYQFLGPGMLFRQSEVKDLIAYLRVLDNFEDSISFFRVLSMDHFGMNARDLAAINNFAKKVNLSLFEAAEVIAAFSDPTISREDKANFSNHLPFISQETKKTLATIVKMIHRHLKLVPKETAGQILYYFLEDTGLLTKFAEVSTVKEEKIALNIAKFFDKLKTFEVEREDASIRTVVDWIEMSMELGESPLAADIDWADVDAVNILTIHSAKGLEFPIVFLVNLVEGRFPTRERREAIPIPEPLIKEILPVGDYHLEEERRLFYVGMTRAKDRLYLSTSNYYAEAKRQRRVSPFVGEALGEKVLKRTQQPAEKTASQLFLFEWKRLTEEVSPKRERRPVTYLSYSQIETFRFCPLHYKAKYILRIPTPSYAAQSFGQTIHTTLKRFYLGLMQEEKWGIDQLLKLYDKAWIPLGFESKKHEQAMKKTGREYLSQFFNTFHQQTTLPKAVEQSFTFPLPNGLKVGGIIDRINKLANGKIEIIDYKTALKVPSQAEVNKDTQLTIYALAATEVKDPPLAKKPEDVVLTLYFLGSQEKRTTFRTKEQLDQAKKNIIDIAKQIEGSDFACSGIGWCKMCEYKMLCSVT